jgi:hypothetical protein
VLNKQFFMSYMTTVVTVITIQIHILKTAVKSEKFIFRGSHVLYPKHKKFLLKATKGV